MLTTDFLRPEKARLLRQLYRKFEDSRNRELADVSARDAWIIPPASPESLEAAVVYESGDTWKITDFCGEISNPEEYISRAHAASDLKPVKGKVLFGGYFHLHWGHFLVQTLSRLWKLFREDDFDKIVFCCHASDIPRIHANIRKALEYTGLNDRIRIISTPQRFSEVIVPEEGIGPGCYFNSSLLPLYDTIARNACKEFPSGPSFSKKIYLSRGRLKKALVNEPCSEWLDDFFRKNGFEILYPESTPLGLYISKIRHADVVAAVSGTIPHNMLFGLNGQKLWIVEKTPILNQFQPGIDLLKNLDVTPVDACGMLQTVSGGSGPFLLYPNHLSLEFAKANNLSYLPEINSRIKRKTLRKFFSIHRRHYSYQWYLEEWVEPEIHSLREAYRDTLLDFGDYIVGKRLFMWRDFFSPRLLAKQLLRFIRERR